MQEIVDMNISNLTYLIEHNHESIIFQCISGSRAYGTAQSHSDEDIRGIFILPSHNYLSFNKPMDTVSDKKSDIVYYSLHRFLELASKASPNIIELLFMPTECIQVLTPCMQKIIDCRQLFVTQKVYDSHVGYAQAQLKKARSQNKWINTPQPAEPPEKASFCWVVLQKDINKACPYRPIPLQESQIIPSHCHVSSLEHAPNIYRLYHIGENACGIFNKDNIVCQSISEDEESNAFIGLLIFNKEGHEDAKRDFKHYWQWRENRNEHRWLNQKKGYLDYDAKNMMHLFRLLFSGKSLLQNQFPIVRFEGSDLEFLMDILSGKYTYDCLIGMAEKEFKQISLLKSKSDLPKDVDIEKMDPLFQDVTKLWENHFHQEETNPLS